MSPPTAALAHLQKELWLSRNSNIDGAVSAVGWALLPVGDNDGQECPSYEDTALSNGGSRTYFAFHFG